MCEIIYTEEEMIGRTNLSFKDAKNKKLHYNKLRG